MTRFNRFRRTLMQWTGSLPLLGALPLSKLAQAQGAEQPAASGTPPAGGTRAPRFAYVGTYTFDAPGGTAGGPPARGIYVLAPRGDAWSQVQVVESANPSFLAVHPNQRCLYAINEIDVYEGRATGTAEAYAIDPRDGRLTLLNRQPLSLSGTIPAHVAVSPDGQHLAVALYGGGAYNVLPIGADGRLGSVSGLFKDTGSGPDTARQEAPHAHMVLFDPTGRHILGTDLGTDRINVFALEDGKLTPRDRAQLKPGGGPRHLALHPSGKLLYVISELDSTVACHGYDPATGRVLDERQRIATTPADYTGQKSGAALVMHPSGRFLYASNRRLKSEHPLADSIAAFSIDPASGRLAALQYWSEGLRFPRALTMADDGRHLYALSQKGDTILRLRIDDATGRLDQPAVVSNVPTPVCLVFAG
ncbi:6-phosphogluconolactonase [Ralstonia solanacearum]|uniref:6-phosphogluconolactonase n=2 Tax=Ralstonia solanacearum species complex TaxID=3116862 RepID=A0A454TQ79_9RALS|nr:lactonase family protein [Ralstonia pseudosolanacearum]AUS43791.1 6-phosphogluconolactonase [Ralstonia solanacearum]AYA48018.1 6-phosphogluconolactonase [Ralstonia pseudosolanacearum]MCK4132096.1 lactonase family protein [Ralstonia pseudosolanacearum]MCK4142301.1 lactonase family protein [Ralstonia pseudosolanacearum]MDK1381430.1 lactonase family protein [Ralstonia pseudosolanacearum]